MTVVCYRPFSEVEKLCWTTAPVTVQPIESRWKDDQDDLEPIYVRCVQVTVFTPGGIQNVICPESSVRALAPEVCRSRAGLTAASRWCWMDDAAEKPWPPRPEITAKVPISPPPRPIPSDEKERM